MERENVIVLTLDFFLLILQIIQSYGGTVDTTLNNRCTHLLCESQVSSMYVQVSGFMQEAMQIAVSVVLNCARHVLKSLHEPEVESVDRFVSAVTRP